jgi:DNA polymerase epsilon subunit 2
MNNSQLSRAVFKAFKLRGLQLQADATEAIINVLSRENDVEGSLKLILDELKDRIEKQDVKSAMIVLATIESIVVDLSSNEDDIAREIVQVFDAFSCPKLHYDERNRTYKVINSPPFKILGTVESRAQMYRERLLLTQQRLLRSDVFTLHGFSGNNKKRHTEGLPIHTIESLLGSEGTKVLFGMITQPEEGVWYLEDLTSMIRLDWSQSEYHPFLFTEGSHVVVQGEAVGDRFRVQVLGMPPAEQRDLTLKMVGIQHTFGSDFRSQHMQAMQALEATADNHLVIILSEVHLDKPLVLAKFEKILEGFEDNGIDPFYILMGSFFSRNYFTVNGGKQFMQRSFAALGESIAKFPRQCENAKFLFVPGPIDAGSSIALPKRPLPSEIVAPLKEMVTHVAFGSNPCKVRLYNQEIVLFREDLLKKMQKHLVVPLKTGDKVADVTEQLVETILSQGHLSPLPLHVRPVHWELDHTLRLFPLPNLLVLADRSEQFSYSCYGTNCVNPGVFASDFSFIVYQPSSPGEIQFSRVPDV